MIEGRDSVHHPRSRYRSKYVIMRQFYEKGLPPEDTARVLAVHINTLKRWCNNMGIPYPDNGPREFIQNMSKSDISSDHFPDDVEVPSYKTNWTKEEARTREINEDDNENDSNMGVLEW